LYELLLAAVARQDLSALKALLATTDPISGDEFGRALSAAADGGWVGGIEGLLEAGADPNWHPAGAPSGFPLSQAIHWLHLTAVERLLDAGACIEARDYQGQTPLHQAVYTEVDLAAEDPPNADLTALLVRRGADVLARTLGGETAMDLARVLKHPAAEKIIRQRLSELP
jgi:ankyrin repeat protein